MHASGSIDVSIMLNIDFFYFFTENVEKMHVFNVSCNKINILNISCTKSLKIGNIFKIK